MTLTCVSEWGVEVDSRLLAALALGVVKRLGGETVVVDEDNNIRTGWRLARVGDVALLEKPADHQSLKRIDCYLIEEENFAGDSSSIRSAYCSRCNTSTTPSRLTLICCCSEIRDSGSSRLQPHCLAS
jgi:hypothetical protein